MLPQTDRHTHTHTQQPPSVVHTQQTHPPQQPVRACQVVDAAVMTRH